MSLVFIGMSLMALLSASMLAIDVGMLMTARGQAQNSADAGALAGATALFYDDYDDRTDTGPAKTNAVNAAIANNVMGAAVSATPADVVFLDDPTGEPNRVRVTVRRSAARGNPVSTLIARYFGMATSDIGATATAEASPSNAMTCVLPFTIPDRWREMHTPAFDPEDDFATIDKKGNPLAVRDVYIGPRDKANYTGYNAERDRGMTVVLKADNGSKLAPSMYQVWDMEGGNRGSDDVRNSIAGCNTQILGFDQTFVHKPGMQTGPVAQGIADLLAKDPDAYWDEDARKPVSPLAKSPRVVAIPLFDPVYYEEGKVVGRNASLKFVNYLGFFIEEMRGGEVIGRITPIGGLRQGGMGPAPAGSFPMTIRLVQ
jgi:Flp pilus assembly protein TadG